MERATEMKKDQYMCFVL